VEVIRTFVDRGGTFTDVAVLRPGGRVTIAKVPSDRAVVGELAEGALTFGTTVATNALLEGRGARTALFVTEGFGDLLRVGDQRRPDLFDSDAAWPPPLTDLVFEVPGRLDADGREVEPLGEPIGLRAGALEGVEALAIALLNSHASPAHELALAARLARGAGLPVALFVALGHEVSPEVGYLARIEMTVVDAAISPPLQASLLRDRIPPEARAMRSDGSLCPARSLRAPDAVLSGPSGGVIAVAEVARQAGFARAIGLDMGGTSTDVCRVDVGALPRREGEVRVAGVRLRRPILEVETIAAGGGSILAFDGRRLTVGPESAGAHPGPQCYGRGGPPTLTDAAVALGLIDLERFPIPLDPAAVELPGDPQAFVDIAREAMAQAIRRVATERGVDLDDHALVAYGGAAGQHAAPVAERLGVRTVLVHPCAAVLCAWGQALARREESAVRALWRPLDTAWPEVVQALDDLAASLPALGEEERLVDLRPAGTDHAIAVAALPDEGVDAVVERFAAAYRRRYGAALDEGPIEVVNARVRVAAPAPSPPTLDEDPWEIGAAVVRGPRLLSSTTTAIWVPAGWTARRADGLLRLDRTGSPPAPRARDRRRTPAGVELWSRRFQAVAEEAGTVLQRLARSVNIKERLDFSCAVFDGAGRLVANAPHIPVHLGAMGETVRDLLAHHPDPSPEQAWLSNDPAAGGSHLPDLTVVTPVARGGRRWFVASRGHHVDVGGLTPGSMPPRSRTLSDEGVVLRNVPLLTPAGGLRDLSAALAGSREPDTVIADLRAQIAANAHAARALLQLGPPEALDAWMDHLREVAAEAVVALLPGLPCGRARDELDGIPLELALEVEDARLTVDLMGTGGPHPGNLNAPQAVVRAAVLYGLRVLCGRALPLNEGCLEPVSLRLPRPSIVAPPPGAAVVGGNVETSQRLVDLFLRAAGARADSAGTMANLTLGAGPSGGRWSLYETLGGGLGASPVGPGADGRQTHMTNTRATDPEVIEARFPLRVRAFALRRGSGGEGRHRGGEGLVRELEVTAPATAALLAAFRPGGAQGLAGGGPGAPGYAERLEGHRWRPWDGEPTALAPGERVRITTPGGGGWGAPASPGDDPGESPAPRAPAA